MMEGPCADSEEKREPAGDIDTVVVDGLKVLDPKRPIREADISPRYFNVAEVPDTDFPFAQGPRRARLSFWGLDPALAL
jgi:hypothetical protein